MPTDVCYSSAHLCWKKVHFWWNFRLLWLNIGPEYRKIFEVLLQLTFLRNFRFDKDYVTRNRYFHQDFWLNISSLLFQKLEVPLSKRIVQIELDNIKWNISLSRKGSRRLVISGRTHLASFRFKWFMWSTFTTLSTDE